MLPSCRSTVPAPRRKHHHCWCQTLPLRRSIVPARLSVQYEVCRLHSQSAVHHVVLSPSTTVFQLIIERTAKKQTECCQPRARSQVFPQQADCDGNALVGEFMVAFLLVFTVLRTAVNSDFVYDRPPTLRLTLRIHAARRAPRSSLHGSCVRLKALSS